MNSDKPDREQLYRQTLDAAMSQWLALQEQERRIIIQKNQLRQTFLALYPLAYPDAQQPDISSMSLANAIRTIIGGVDRAMTAIELRGKLTDLGFDLSKYDNPLANIHTTMNRMVEAEEMVWESVDEKKVLPGPELKHVPAPPPAKTDDATRNQILEILGTLNPPVEAK